MNLGHLLDPYVYMKWPLVWKELQLSAWSHNKLNLVIQYIINIWIIQIVVVFNWKPPIQGIVGNDWLLGVEANLVNPFINRQ